MELGILLTDHMGGATASYELAPGSVEIVARSYQHDHPDREAVYGGAIMGLRRGLALAGCTGQMAIRYEDLEDKGAADRVIDALTPEDLTISPEDCTRAREELAEWYEEQEERAARVGEFMEAQLRRPDEEVTLGEAERRHKEGADEVRRIVEGE